MDNKVFIVAAFDRRKVSASLLLPKPGEVPDFDYTSCKVYQRYAPYSDTFVPLEIVRHLKDDLFEVKGTFGKEFVKYDDLMIDESLKMIQVSVFAAPHHLKAPSLLDCTRLGEGFCPVERTDSFSTWMVDSAFYMAVGRAIAHSAEDSNLLLNIQKATKRFKEKIGIHRDQDFFVHSEEEVQQCSHQSERHGLIST